MVYDVGGGKSEVLENVKTLRVHIMLLAHTFNCNNNYNINLNLQKDAIKIFGLKHDLKNEVS